MATDKGKPIRGVVRYEMVADKPAETQPLSRREGHGNYLPTPDQEANLTGILTWRYWIATRLATALVSARSIAKCTIEPGRFALERLRLDGIDPEWWRPEPGLWDDLMTIEASTV